MFRLYCLCKFRNTFTELEPPQEYVSIQDAQWAARTVAMNKRVPVRVVDEQGNTWFEANFPMRG